ncbi:MAG TPA: hypothetical protein VGW76_12190 [Pyrinomonadaceae bacterium]|nr:hypothetical protein [Pyrinomonadaceae bacterium]
MNPRRLRRIIGFILAALLATATLILSSPAVGAQRQIQRRVVIIRPVRPFRSYDPFGSPYTGFNRFRYNQYVFSNSEEAYNHGYKDGRETGEKDGRKDKSYDPERSHYFQEAGFGNFAEAYRDGFSQGYRDGFGSRAG